jgi:hypothetical protein
MILYKYTNKRNWYIDEHKACIDAEIYNIGFRPVKPISPIIHIFYSYRRIILFPGLI